MSRGTIARLDLAALAHNFAVVRRLAGGSRVIAVIKADAYGHGLVRVARALRNAEMFAVATLDEALAIRAAGLQNPVMLLEGFHEPAELPDIAAYRFEVVIHHRDQVAALKTHRGLAFGRVWLKADTGMHRLGLPPAAVRPAWEDLHSHHGIGAIGLMSHFACADQPAHPQNARQSEAFRQAFDALPGPRTLANSAALLNLPESRLDWVRPGLLLYGISPVSGRPAAGIGLKPVMSLHSRLIAVHNLAAGETVGYGAAWRAAHPTRLGIAAIGYGDGYSRRLPSGIPVLVNGRRAELAGHVSMDMIAIALPDDAPAQVGDEVLLWGGPLPVEQIAAAAGMIPYEIICGITRRVEYQELGNPE